jgi:hypothetical protein
MPSLVCSATSVPTALARSPSSYSIDLRVVDRPEPAAFGQRFGQHALKRGCGVHHDVLGVRETPRLDQGRESLIHLGCAIGAIGQSHLIIGRQSRRPHRSSPGP